MRDLVFKNLTSDLKKRKIISCSETFDKEGLRSTIRRHFICAIKEIKDKELKRPLPSLYVLKETNTKEHREKFLCKIKGSVYVVHEGKLYIIFFMHSLRIDVTSIPEDSVNYSEEPQI